MLQPAQNQGVGGAYVCWDTRGVELGSDILVKMDGDGQMDAAYLPALLDAIVEQITTMRRGPLPRRESLAQMPKVRLIGNIVLTFMTKLATATGTSSTRRTATRHQGDALRVLDLKTIHKRFFFENDMLVHLNYQNLRVRRGDSRALRRRSLGLESFQDRSDVSVPSARRFLPSALTEILLRDFLAHRALSIHRFLLFFLGNGVRNLHLGQSVRTGTTTPTGTIHAGAAATNPRPSNFSCRPSSSTSTRLPDDKRNLYTNSCDPEAPNQ